MSSPQVIGWEPMQAEWWLTIRASLSKPWPREAVLMDLRFWRGQEVATAHRAERLQVRRPGRPTLLKEWGWTDWAVKEAFKAEDEWARPGAEVAASYPPAHRQLPTSPPPALERLEAKNIEESTSPPPATHQPTASAPPRARSLLRDSEDQRSEIRSEVRPSVSDVQSPQVHLFAPIGLPPAEPPEASSPVQTPLAIPEAPIKHPGAVSGASQSKPTAPKESTGDAERVWKAWRKIRKGCREEIPQDAKKAMSAALKGNSAEEIEGVIGWVHLGSHDRARFLRGGADPGECNADKAYGLVTVLRHMGEYLELARAEGQSSGPIILDADGNVEAPKPQKAAPNRANSIDSAASTYELAQLLRAEEAKHGFGP